MLLYQWDMPNPSILLSICSIPYPRKSSSHVSLNAWAKYVAIHNAAITGIKSEQYPLMMIDGGAEMKEMPDLGNMVIDWIPVDFAAASIVQIMLKVANDNTGSPEQVYHIVNPNMVTW